MAMSSASWSLTARLVFPVDRPPLERGVVVVDGEKIVAVEAHGVRTADLDLGDAAVLPGLVNAHTHLDLTGARGRVPFTGDFTEWLNAVIAHRRGVAAEHIQADVRAGMAESVAFGVSLVGDISGQGLSWPILAESPLRSVVFFELLGLTRSGAVRACMNLKAWLADKPRAGPICRPGVSPHAPYSVRREMFRQAASLGLPLAVHLAETAAELDLLELHSGPFVPFLRDLGVWDATGLAKSPDRVLWNTRRAASVAFAHGNYLKPDARIPTNGAIVYCPRTHAYFSHPPHPFREFLARGVRVAVGTDSLASNPDLDVLAEIRFLHRLYPDLPGAVLLRMATLSGAEALGWADETGSLTPGKSADLIVVPLPPGEDADPHRSILGADLPVRRVLFRGRWVYPS